MKALEKCMNGIEVINIQINSKLNIAPSGNALGVQHSKLILLHGLGWKHSVKLQDGIEKMYTWYKESK